MKSFNHKQLPEAYASIETTVKQKICLLSSTLIKF